MAHRDPDSHRRITSKDPLALTVPCSRCHSAVGAPCRTYTGARKPPCPQRRNEALLAVELSQVPEDDAGFDVEPETAKAPFHLELQYASFAPEDATIEGPPSEPLLRDARQLALFQDQP